MTRRKTGPNGRIAFASLRNGNRDVYVVDVRTKRESRLTDSPVLDGHPAWSPDGSRLAFSSIDEGIQAIYTMRANGSGLRRVAAVPGRFSQSPAWSPDGKRIAFYATEANLSTDANPSHIWIVNADGSRLHRLAGALAHGRDPSWSPDGKRIAYTVFNSAGGSTVQGIYVLTIAGGTNEYIGMGVAPAWSPEGNRVAYREAGTGHAIVVAEVDGTNMTQLYGGIDWPGHPSWSSDSRWIVFDRDPDGHTGTLTVWGSTSDVETSGPQPASLWIIRADGRGLRRLTQGGDDTLPSWGVAAQKS